MNSVIKTRFSHYILNLPDIDAEHEHLCHLFEELAVTIDIDIIKTRPVLEKILCCSRQHFDIEEQFMQSIEYPYYEFHKEVHLNLISMLEDACSTKTLTREIVTLLEDAIYNHIEVYDRQIADFLNPN